MRRVSCNVSVSRSLATQNHYPAIDVLQSVSRVMPSITSNEHRELAGRLRELNSMYDR